MLIDRLENKILTKLSLVYSTFFNATADES